MNSQTSENNDWVKTTEYLAHAPEIIFKNFRLLPIFSLVIEGADIEGGGHLLLRLKRNRYFREALPLILKSENFEPSSTQKLRINGKILNISSTIVRYCNNTCNLINLFGPELLNGTIVEIGGGYGGECKIIHDFGTSMGALPKSFVIYDLATSTGLIRRYLSFFGYDKNVEIRNDITHPQGEIDLIISNGAFSEMDRELQQDYLKNIISKSNNGYFVTNFHTHSEPRGGFSLNEFVGILRSMGKNVVVLSPTYRWLSAYDTGMSELIVFGDQLNISSPPGSNIDYFRYKTGKRLFYCVKKCHGAINRFIFN